MKKSWIWSGKPGATLWWAPCSELKHATLLLLSACAQAPVGDDSAASPHEGGERGRELYAAHCSVCHGAHGGRKSISIWQELELAP